MQPTSTLLQPQSIEQIFEKSYMGRCATSAKPIHSVSKFIEGLQHPDVNEIEVIDAETIVDFFYLTVKPSYFNIIWCETHS